MARDKRHRASGKQQPKQKSNNQAKSESTVKRPELYYRREREVQVSNRHYDLVSLVTVDPTKKEHVLEKLLKIYWQVHHQIYDQLVARCPRVIELHKHPSREVRPKGFSPASEPLLQCCIDPLQYKKDVIKKKIFAHHAQAGNLKKPDLKKWWAYPQKIMPCAMRVDHRDQHTAVAFGKTDFYILFGSQNQYWAAIGRMMLARQPEIAGILSLPGHRVKVIHQKYPENWKPQITEHTGDPLYKKWKAAYRKWVKGGKKADEKQLRNIMELEKELAQKYSFSPDEQDAYMRDENNLDFQVKKESKKDKDLPLVLFTLVRPVREIVYSFAQKKMRFPVWLYHYLDWRDSIKLHKGKDSDDQRLLKKLKRKPGKREAEILQQYKQYKSFLRRLAKEPKPIKVDQKAINRLVRKAAKLEKQEVGHTALITKDCKPVDYQQFYSLIEQIDDADEQMRWQIYRKAMKILQEREQKVRMHQLWHLADQAVKTQRMRDRYIKKWQEDWQLWNDNHGFSQADKSGVEMPPAPPMLAKMFIMGVIDGLMGNTNTSKGKTSKKSGRLTSKDDVRGFWFYENECHQNDDDDLDPDNFLPNVSRMEIFLTHSDIYPIMIKTQYRHPERPYEFGVWLRSKTLEPQPNPLESDILDKVVIGPIDTATLPSISGECLLDEVRLRALEPGKSANYFYINKSEAHPDRFKLEESMSFSLMVKMRGGNFTDGVKDIRNILLGQQVKCEDGEVVDLLEHVDTYDSDRPMDHWSLLSFWDVEFKFRTRYPTPLILTLANKIRHLPNVAYTALRPLGMIKSDPPGQTKSKVAHAVLKFEPVTLPENLTLPEKVKEFPVVPPSDKDNLQECKLFHLNLTMQVEWLQNYLLLLEHSWSGWEQLVYSKVDSEPPETFSLMKDEIVQYLTSLQMIAKKLAAIEDENQTEAPATQLADIWSDLDRIRGNLVGSSYGFKSRLMMIASRFKEEGEVIQAVSNLEPILKVGEPSGITTLSLHVANRLFQSYCGIPKREYFGHLRAWNGVITTTSGTDFAIHPNSRILEMPLDFKFNVIEKMTPLAHEAAHLVLRDLQQTFSPKQKRVDSPWEVWYRLLDHTEVVFEAFQVMHYLRHVWLGFIRPSCFSDELCMRAYHLYFDGFLAKNGTPHQIENLLASMGIESWESPSADDEQYSFRVGLAYLLAKIRGVHSPFVDKFIRKTKNFIQKTELWRAQAGFKHVEQWLNDARNLQYRTDEVLSDLLALVSCGPAFALNLYRYIGRSGGSKVYPLPYNRLGILRTAARQMQWTGENDDYDPWQVWQRIDQRIMGHAPGKDFPVIGKTCKVDDAAAYVKQVFQWFERFVLNWSFLPSNRGAEDYEGIDRAFAGLTGEREKSELKQQVDSIHHLFAWVALELTPDFMWDLLRQTRKIGLRFQFYPFVAENIENKEEKEIYHSIVKATDAYCCSLMERLVYNCELLLNAPVKYIAAGASLPDCRHLTYPTGRVLLSIRYSDGGRTDLVQNYLWKIFDDENKSEKLKRKLRKEGWIPEYLIRKKNVKKN